MRRFGWGRRVLLGVLLVGLLLVPVDVFYLSPARAAASAHLFSLEQWEVSHFLSKWLHLLWDKLPGSEPSRDERLAILDEFLVLSRRAQKEKDRIEGFSFRDTAMVVPRGADASSRDHLNELLAARGRLRPDAEESLEAELSAVVNDVGLGSRTWFLFPPVDVRLDQPPTVLITSPRDRIKLQEAVLLDPDLPLLVRDRLEREMLERYDLSAFVDNLAGLATYPALVSDVSTLRTILRNAAHEWLHAYFFFRPLGQHIYSSDEMFTLNETAADLAGRELGDMTFARMGGDLNESPSRYLPEEKRDPAFTSAMRETRLHVDELLDQGKIEEAERYMKERWWLLRLAGYRLRKLNQAYFAFHGRYAEGAASVSPIGEQIKELRRLRPNVGAFVKAVSGVSSHQELLDLLERLRDQSGADGSEAPAVFSLPSSTAASGRTQQVCYASPSRRILWREIRRTNHMTPAAMTPNTSTMATYVTASVPQSTSRTKGGRIWSPRSS